MPDECDLAGEATLPCAIIEFAPGASTGPFGVEGNEMIIPSGGVQVEYEILLAGWGNTPGSPLLGAYNMVIEGTSLLGANAMPFNPGVDLTTTDYVQCDNASDCPAPFPPPVTASGTCGVIFPGFCDDFGAAFFLPAVCSNDLVTPCRTGAECLGGAWCISNPRFVFPSYLHPYLEVRVLGGNSFQWLGLPWMIPVTGREDPDGVTKFLAGNLRLIVPEGAGGTYTIRFRKGWSFTFVNTPSGVAIPSTIIHGQLTIGGACCMADGSCEILLESDCESEGGAYFGGFCGGDSHNDGEVHICEVMGDIDGDGYVGLSDWLLFVPCMEGPADDVDGSQCTPANLNRDTSVDLEDVALFIAGFTG